MTDPQNNTSRLPTREGVAARQAEVSAFFSNDFSRLRSLMLQLEDTCLREEEFGPQTSLSEDRDEVVPSVASQQHNDSPDELEYLAEHIEQQLRIANREGKPSCRS